MIILGKTRGNAPQLASYLLAQGENEKITILDVDNKTQADAQALKDLLFSMELNSELTKSRNSVYHAVINPKKEDRVMTVEEWYRSADILAKNLNLEDQRRVIVLHQKPDERVHAHVVFERYDHEKGKMVSDSNNYLAHDRARQQMEQELGHEFTPQKNVKRPEHKKALSKIWQQTRTGAEFITEAREAGYEITKGTDRPFKVIDPDGISHNLIRQLENTKTAEVKARLKNEDLMSEKQALINSKRQRQETNNLVLNQPVEAKEAGLLDLARESQQAENERGVIGLEQIKEEVERAKQEQIRQIKAERERNRSHSQERSI